MSPLHQLAEKVRWMHVQSAPHITGGILWQVVVQPHDGVSVTITDSTLDGAADLHLARLGTPARKKIIIKR